MNTHGETPAAGMPEGGPSPAAVWGGAALWIAFCCVAAPIRGVVWDEGYEWGRIIAHLSPYPDGHPLYVFTRNAFTVLTYASAGLLRIGFGPEVVCGHRNILFLAATVLPVFFLTTALSRRVLFGHAAAALTLAGIHLGFGGSYPQFTWPTMFSNGHIGTGYALLTLALLIANRRGAALFMLGFMPAVHVGQMPPLLLLAGAQFLWSRREGEAGRAWLRALPFGAAGAALCAAVWLAQRPFAVTPPDTGVYAPGGDFLPVWRGITAFFDMHRMRPKTDVYIAAAGALLLTGAAGFRECRETGRPGPWTWIFVYGAGLCGAVGAVVVVHRVMGPETPFLLLRTMPYRLFNHMPLLLIVATAGVLAIPTRANRSGAPEKILALALMYIALHPLLRHVVGDTLYGRYAIPRAGMPFALFGAAAAVWMTACDPPRPGFGALLICLALLAPFHQFGAACGLAGALGTLALLRWAPGAPRRFGVVAAAAACVIAVAAMLHWEWSHRDPLPVSPFERDVAAYLDARRDEGPTLIVQNPSRWLTIAKTGHPVMTDAAMPTWVSYMPALAAPVRNIYADIYGWDFAYTPGMDARAEAGRWLELWPRRTRDEWSDLARAYGFRYVMAPNLIALELDEAVRGADETLYDVFPSGTR